MRLFDHFTTTFNSSDLASWIVLVFLAVLPLVQVWLVVRNDSLSISRKWVRAALNLLFWVVLLGYFFQIEWEMPTHSKAVLVADNEVPTAYVNHLKNSLKSPEAVRINAFKTPAFRERLDDGSLDSVTLIGTGFSPDLLGELSRQTVQWIPYYQPDQLRMIRWKGILRKGDIQSVEGSIQSSQKQVLKIRFGNQTLDSLQLPAGYSDFKFQFPAFSQGRAEIELVLNQKPLDTLRYFTRNTEPIAYLFMLDSPDFESKTLADWLGKKGYSVQLTSTISKDISNRTTINRTAAPDVIITDPANAANPIVKKAATQGKPVLVINLSDAETDIKTINQALGTNWRVKRISTEATVLLGNGVQALPYQLTDAPNQFAVYGYPVAIQKTAGKFGLSLISETFPLKLSGDSATYDRIWTSILTQLQPTFKDNIQVDAPVFKGVRSVLYFNNLSNKPATVRIGNNTVNLNYSAINGLSAEALYLFNRAGWQSFQDTLAVYVDKPAGKPAFGSHLVSDYLRIHSTESAGKKTVSPHWLLVKIPDWVWLILFLSCLTALWIEPKFSI
jgi:hypothetical protein